MKPTRDAIATVTTFLQHNQDPEHKLYRAIDQQTIFAITHLLSIASRWLLATSNNQDRPE